MSSSTLTFPSIECPQLLVRRFSVREALSKPFEIAARVVSPDADIDIEALIGQPAMFILERSLILDTDERRVFQGICRAAEQVKAEESGLSTYQITIVSPLWLLSQRNDYRIFQHKSIPGIVRTILNDWNMPAVMRVDDAAHPQLEMRVQYGETDLTFVSRLLEEAGITFFFANDDRESPMLILSDSPHGEHPRASGPLRYVDNPSDVSPREVVTDVQVAREIRPGSVCLVDSFFRRPELPLIAGAQAKGIEERLTMVHYAPGAFVAEGAKPGETPVADGKGVARADERAGLTRAQQVLASLRGPRKGVSFRTNVLGSHPGTVFSIDGHARSEFGFDRKLLVTNLVIEGSLSGEWSVSGRAVFADEPYRPALETSKPIVHGVQSAIVVGPAGQDIHTDEFGRVRVRFPWDRVGRWDDDASCWMRVSQSWAGPGYGFIALPRVNQEVLVGFVAGDPDQPIVVGRVFGGTNPVPNKLPESRTRSTWRSSSVPGGEGFNEITFEDAKGAELVYMQAERNLEKLVKVDETITVGQNRTKFVKVNEFETTGIDRTVTVGVNRTTAIGAVDATHVGVQHSVTMAEGAQHPQGIGPTGITMVDRRITLTTGEATITLDGPNMTFDVPGTFTVRANNRVRIESSSADVIIQGGPMVRINPRGAGEKPGSPTGQIPFEFPDGVGADDFNEHLTQFAAAGCFDPEAPHYIDESTAPGGALDPTPQSRPDDAFRAFQYAVAGRTIGIPASVLIRRAGALNIARNGQASGSGDPGNGVFGGKSPFGTTDTQHAAIKTGFDWFDKHIAGDADA